MKGPSIEPRLEGDPGFLAKVLVDLGPESCDRNTFLDILQQLKSLLKNDVECPVALALLQMCTSSNTSTSGYSSMWNMQAFGSAVLESFPKTDLNLIICHLDHPQLQVAEPKAAELLFRALRALSKLDVKKLLTPWSHLRGQLKLIFNSLLLPPDILNFSMFNGQKVVSMEEFSNFSPAARNIASTLGTQTWNRQELFEYTAQIIDTECFEDAKPIFELASRQCPELLCIALASIDPSWNSINKEILVKLTCGFLLGQPSSVVVLPRIWALNPNVLLFCMVEMHRREQSCLSRLLDVAQDLKILPIILDAKPYSFTLDLACLASRRQHLNLEKWLSESVKEKGELFLRSAVEFLGEKMSLLSRPRSSNGHSPQSIPIAADILNLFMKVLLGAFPLMPSDVAEQFRELHRYASNDPNGTPLGGSLGSGIMEREQDPNSMPEISFANDVEEEVNSFFDRIFAREVAVADVVEVLKRLKGSNNVRDQQVFACFLHNLFDEYRFFAKYPDSELSLTAILFGQIINCGLVSFVPLGLALRCVLDALKKPPSQKLFRFGLQALIQFHGRLVEWPQYCSHLLQIPHLQQASPELFTHIRSSLSGIQTSQTVQLSASESSPIQGVTPSTIGQGATATNDPGNPLAEAAETQKLIIPAEGVRDKILFILNNLSVGNLETKANDLVKILEEVHFEWLAQYLVVRRACLEPNFHSLYLEFLNILQLQALLDQVLSQTYSNIYILLQSPKITNSTSERSLLKNLGMWLGGLTLARDQPILHRDLSLKDLLMEAFTTDRLIVIVPFVCKVAEQCIKSRAFQPANPWLMSILRLLSELYNFADLKLNLKFEIEVLCKNLHVDLQAIEPSHLLKQKPSLLLQHGATSRLEVEGDNLSWPNSPIMSLIVLKDKSSSRSDVAVKKILGLAIEYAVREIALSVTQRAIQNAIITAKAIVSKDFAGEVDKTLSKQAASNMAAALTASISVVMARETLKPLIISNFRLFSQWARISHVIPDVQMEDIIEDNLDLACAYIEKISIERSRPQLESLINEEIETAPKLKASSKITPEQLRVYDDFARRCKPAHLTTLPPISSEPGTHEELERLAMALSTPSASAGNSHPKPEGAILSPGVPAVEGNLDAYFESICLKFVELVASIERSIQIVSDTEVAVSKLPPNHEIRPLMKQIVLLASSSPIHRDELCLLMSQRLMQGLYKTDSPLYVDVIILLLIKIFEFSSKAAKEVTTWVVHSTDERKYSVLATAALFGSGLIYVLDFDGQLAKQIESGQDTAITFAVDLIRQCVFGDPPVAAPYDFVYSLEALGKLASEDPSRPSISALLKDISVMVKTPQPQSQLLRDQITFCFTDWFRLCQYPSISDKLISSFVAQLLQRQFLADECSARPFFQICTELCIELYVRQRRAPAILAYRSIDAFARLVGQILRFHPGVDDGVGLDQARIITIVHSVAGLILIQGLDQGLDYLQRPFARLFVSLSTEILRHAKNSWDILQNLSTFYMMISPAAYPSFAFGWFELVINREFLPRLLSVPDRKGWPILAQMLTEFLDFSYPLMVEYDAHECSRALYRGLLRGLLVILHDCPEFFVTYGLQLSSRVPPTAIQLRNTMLSAVPDEFEGLDELTNLPDPLSARVSTLYKREDRIVESSNALPLSVSSELKALSEPLLINPKAPMTLHHILERCKRITIEGGHLDWSLRAFSETLSYMFHLTASTYSEGIDMATKIAQGGNLVFEFLQLACTECGSRGRYLAICAAVDHLNYPSSLTSLFYSAILYLFSTGTDTIKESITRVLLERLIVHRPHPWGVMVTFIELVRNPRYRFWESGFTRATPDIERVFEAISRSCLGQ